MFTAGWSTANNHGEWAWSDRAVAIIRIFKIANIIPLIVFVLSDDWSSPSCWFIVCIAANDVNTLIGGSCGVMWNSKNLSKTISERRIFTGCGLRVGWTDSLPLRSIAEKHNQVFPFSHFRFQNRTQSRKAGFCKLPNYWHVYGYGLTMALFRNFLHQI